MKKQCKKSVISKLFEYYLLPIVFVSIIIMIRLFFFTEKGRNFLIYEIFFEAFISVVNIEIFFIAIYIKNIYKEMFNQWFIIIECLLFVFVQYAFNILIDDMFSLLCQYFILYPIVIIITMYVVILLKELIRRWY